MQIYVRRGIQGKVRDASDMMGTELEATRTGYGATAQYEPYYLEKATDTTRDYEATENMEEGGGLVRTVDQDEQTQSGTITYGWGGSSGEEDID